MGISATDENVGAAVLSIARLLQFSRSQTRPAQGELMPDGSWKMDDTVVLFFCVFGFGGGIATQKAGMPSIVVALLLATGVASLIYRFLGGVSDSSFAIGALKLTGTAAFLVGMTLLVNAKLPQQSVAPSSAFTTADLVNHTWRWDYGTGGWTGDFYFSLDEHKNIIFNGTEFYRCTAPGKCDDLYDISNGRAEIVDGGLVLHAHARDRLNGRYVDWQTGEPLKKTVAFEGSLQDPSEPSQNYGISLFRRTY